MPLDHNMNHNGKRAYLLEHTNASTPSNGMQRQIYSPQLCNAQVHPPLTYNDGRDGAGTVRMQTAGEDWGYDQSYSTMELNSTTGLNALEGIGESHSMTMVAESTSLADNQVHGNYIPHNTTMDAESTILADNQVRGKYSPRWRMGGHGWGGSPIVLPHSPMRDDKNTILVDTKKKTIRSELKGHDQYNSIMRAAEDHYNVETLTMKGNATESTIEDIGNSRKTTIAKERTILVEDKEHGNDNSGIIIAEVDSGEYHNSPQRTIVDVTAKNSIKDMNNSQNAAGAQNYNKRGKRAANSDESSSEADTMEDDTRMDASSEEAGASSSLGGSPVEIERPAAKTPRS